MSLEVSLHIHRVSVYILALLAAGSFLAGIHQAHGSPTAYASPQPARCTVPNSVCEQRQVWTEGAALGTTNSASFTNGIRIAITFSIPNTNIIQSDNELGACIAAYAPTNYPEDIPFTDTGRDYVYTGCVNVDGDGSMSFVSTAWISCEWQGCNTNTWSGCFPGFCTPPFTQSNRSDCLTSGSWNTCPDDLHWQLWHSRFFCTSCRVTDNYLIEMTWVPVVPNPYAWWNYFQNGNVMQGVSYTQRSDWQAGTGYKYEYGTVGCTQCQWSHYQFGVTSLYDVGSSGWHVDMTNPEYRGSDERTWYLLPTVSYAGGQWAFTDQKYVLGGMPYPNVAVTSSVDTTNCSEKLTFTDTGSSGGQGGPWAALWTNVNSGCSFSSLDPDFSMASNPTTVDLCPGSYEGGVSITLQSQGRFSGAVSLYASPPQSFGDTSFSFNPLILTSGGSAITALYITPGGASTGTYTIVVSGVNNGLFHSISVTAVVTFNACSGGGGSGSVARGSLITMADGRKVPVQDLRIGDRVVVYNVPTGYQTVATVYAVRTVTVNSTLTIHTTVHGRPFRSDANPYMKMWVFTPAGPIEKPITTIKTGDHVYNYDIRSWVRVTDVTITYGGHPTMYDLLTTPNFTSNGLILEYIANGYPDCPPRGCKTSPPG